LLSTVPPAAALAEADALADALALAEAEALADADAAPDPEEHPASPAIAAMPAAAPPRATNFLLLRFVSPISFSFLPLLAGHTSSQMINESLSLVFD